MFRRWRSAGWRWGWWVRRPPGNRSPRCSAGGGLRPCLPRARGRGRVRGPWPTASSCSTVTPPGQFEYVAAGGGLPTLGRFDRMIEQDFEAVGAGADADDAWFRLELGDGHGPQVAHGRFDEPQRIHASGLLEGQLERVESGVASPSAAPAPQPAELPQHHGVARWRCRRGRAASRRRPARRGVLPRGRRL